MQHIKMSNLERNGKAKRNRKTRKRTRKNRKA